MCGWVVSTFPPELSVVPKVVLGVYDHPRVSCRHRWQRYHYAIEGFVDCCRRSCRHFVVAEVTMVPH
nr:expressed protein [Hymenolepis microstoma]